MFIKKFTQIYLRIKIVMQYDCDQAVRSVRLSYGKYAQHLITATILSFFLYFMLTSTENQITMRPSPCANNKFH